jgi:hypothetical protein
MLATIEPALGTDRRDVNVTDPNAFRVSRRAEDLATF